MVEKKILDTILQHQLIKPNGHIVLGLSGGPDSVCLFYALLGLSKEYGWHLHPVHINHKLRDGAADEDQRYTEELCEKAGCPCRTFICDCAALAAREKITSEEAGRKVRYEGFARVAADLRAKGISADEICIAVAHNADDQAETVLFRLLRGTGVDGLAGIRYRRTDSYGNLIVRPLLSVKREEVLAYCRSKNLNPRMDETNSRPLYTRNRIRLELIPYLEKEYNPSVKDTMIRLGKAAAVDSEFLQAQAEEAYEKMTLARSASEILLKGEELRKCHKAVRRRVLLRAFFELGAAEDITAAQIENCEKIVFHKSPSARCDLSNGLYLSRVYEDVKAGRNIEISGGRGSAGETGGESGSLESGFSEAAQSEQKAQGAQTAPRVSIWTMDMENYRSMMQLRQADRPAETAEPSQRVETAAPSQRAETAAPLQSQQSQLRQPQNAKLFAAFDSDLLAEEFGGDFKDRLQLGFRSSGDFIRLSASHRKKIQDYFVDAKVPKDKRDSVPLLKIGREVLWILPVLNRGRFTAKYRLCEDTKNVICIEIIC